MIVCVHVGRGATGGTGSEGPMACSVGRRVVAAAIVPAVAAGVSGCGTARQGAAPAEAEARAPAALVTAATLRREDVPKGFLPADDQEVFRGIRPSDPDCARLLRMVDGASGRSSAADPDVPQSHTAYYRAEPAATLVEHVLRLPRGEAAERMDEVRRAVAACPAIDLGPSGGGWDGRRFDGRGLGRVRLTHPRRPHDVVAVRYTHPGGGRRYGLDAVFARTGRDFLALAALGEFGERGENRLRRMEALVLHRLADAHDSARVVLTPTRATEASADSASPTPTPQP
ncbi:hypothetical protein DZF91_06200 [Actinomadura logoneensis]|uniref:PknH-like extracellular domain-containing protein n=1 Tax=Actinomadura logoneensis TaxID=2293572 RepID=A0A372JRA4_9ACTN|nr:hypothetical protein [Actinomadura logoneensis]RFU42479.1 hypothetical protein DZF91_06200 [Actinomadura logoneensis]